MALTAVCEAASGRVPPRCRRRIVSQAGGAVDLLPQDVLFAGIVGSTGRDACPVIEGHRPAGGRSSIDHHDAAWWHEEDPVKAIVQDRFGPPEVLRLADTGLPEVGADDVLVRVHAAALNPADWHIVRGDPLVARLMGVGLTRPKARVAGSTRRAWWRRPARRARAGHRR